MANMIAAKEAATPKVQVLLDAKNNPPKFKFPALSVYLDNGTTVEKAIEDINSKYTDLNNRVVEIDKHMNNGELSADTAKRLETPRTINGVLFDGTKNITITAAANGGNATTATKLTPGRKINGVLFDGSKDITINATASGGTSSTCTGNAGSATKLQTARKINGVAFDGTKDITITAAANGGTASKISPGRKINGVLFDGSKDITIKAAANGGNADTVDGFHLQIAQNASNIPGLWAW